jgi:hypothetical protein
LWLYLTSLCAVVSLAFSLAWAGDTYGSFFDSKQSTDNALIPSNWWVQTTQSDFEAGVLNNADTSASPNDVELALVPNPTIITSDNSEVSTGTSSSAQLLKTLNFTRSGSAFNEIRIDSNLKVVGGTSVTISIRLNDTEIFSHTTTSSTYVTYNDSFDFSGYADGAYTLKLYLTVSGGNGYNQLFELYTTSPVLEVSDNNEVNATGNTNWQLKKTLTFTKSGSAYNNLRFDTNLKVSSGTKTVSLRIDINDVTKFSHSTTSSTYQTCNDVLDFSGYADGTYIVKLYLQTESKNQSAYNSKFEIWRTSPALVASNNNEYSVSGTLDWQLMKILTITKDGATYNEIRVDTNLKSSGSATAYISIRVDDVEKASHNTTSTTYVSYNDVINLSSYSNGEHTVKIYMKTNNKNQPAYNSLFEIYRTKTYASSGTIASQVYDSQITGAIWDELYWSESLSSGTDITFEVRASDASFAKDNTSLTWNNLGTAGSPVNLSATGKYFQWRAILTTSGDRSVTPILHDVTVYYPSVT